VLEDRVAGASRSRCGRKFDAKDVSWTLEIMSDQRRLLLKVVLGSLSVPNYWISDAGINALQDHRPSSFVLPFPVPLPAQGARLAGRSSVSPQVAAARK
jgi:hypothetical protein